MNALAGPISSDIVPPSSALPGPRTRWSGRRLLVARAVWLVLALLSISVLIAAIVVRLASLDRFTPASVPPGWTLEALRSALESLGLSIGFYLALNLFFAYLTILGFVATALVIFVRRSDDWVALYVSMMLLLWPFSFLDFSNLTDQIPAFAPQVHLISALGTVLVVPFFFIFPNGGLVPHLGRWIIAGWVILVLSSFIVPGSVLDATTWPVILNFLTQAFFLCAGVIAQIYRYVRVSNGVERQQTKWVVLNATLMALTLLTYVLVKVIFPQVSQMSVPGLIYILALPVLLSFFLLIPVGVGFSVLRYRLWDIDLLINRTLVYVPLTAILAGLFAASVALFQRAFLAASGQQSDFAAVLGTLVVVAALTPVKDRLQTLVDKRFKQEPESIRRLRAFGDQVRSRVNPVETNHVARRLLEEAVTALGASSGGASWQGEGAMRMIASVGEWRGEAKLSVPFATGDDGKQLGLVSLGARKNGTDYTPKEREALRQVASDVATAIQQDLSQVSNPPPLKEPA